MFKKIAFWLLVAGFFGAGIYAYMYLTAAKKPKVMALQAIPDDCVFIVESSDFFKLWKKLNETNLIWQELQQVDYFQDIREKGKIIDSVLSADEEVKEIFTGNPVYLAGIQFEDKRDYLYALNVNMKHAGKLVDFVKRIAVDLSETETKNTKEKIWQFTLKTGKGHLFLYVKDGLALISQKPQILDHAIACINKNCVANDARFKKVSEMAGTSVDFRFYSNAAWSGKMYLNFLKRNSLFEALSAKQTQGWTEVDVDFKPNEMKMNGFTIPDSSSFLNYLAAQAPQEYKFINAVPQSADNFLFLGLEDFSELYNNVEKNVLTDIDRNNHKKLFSDLSNKVGMDLRDKIINAIGNEIAAIHTDFSDSIKDNFCIVHLKDKEAEEENFHLLADSILHLKIKFNENEQSDSVYYFKSDELIPALTCGVIARPFHFCFFYADYLVFCESPAAWGRYLEEVSKGKVLAENENFLRFKEGNISEESNLFLYSFFSSSKNFISDFFNEGMKTEIEKHAELFNKFHSAGFQLSSYKGLLLNQAYVLYSPIYNRHNNTVWEVKLDTTAVMSPKIVLNHKTGLEEIFTQDLDDNIYLISNTGKILWKKRLDGRIKSDIFQVDFFQNNKLQFLFNTEKAIYMIDRNGNYVTGYPIQLPVAATNGINVFDYEKNRDYRIAYCGADKKIYIYKASGKLVEGFEFKGTEDSVTVPLQWERINFKDYLVAFDESGSVYGLGRKGENRLSVSEKIPLKNYAYNIQYGKDIDKTKFCFYDVANKKMMKVFLNNKKEEFSVPTELEDPASFVCKINDDDNFDLVLVKDKYIEIYDDQGSLIQKVKTTTELKPFFRQLQKNNETYYAFIDKENNLLIFSANWQEPEKSTAKCSQLPAIEMLNDDGYFYLIGIHNDLVSCYPF